MKFINANKLRRKSGGMGHPSFVREPGAKRGASLSLRGGKGCENTVCRMNRHRVSRAPTPRSQNCSQERITTTTDPISYLPRNIT
jgi:hypothetical protein